MIEEWQKVLSEMTYGIYVLTSRFEEKINGMVASWVSQVSHDPPLIMAAIHPNRYTCGLVQQGGHFVLNVLSQEQKALIKNFKGPDASGKFVGIPWSEEKTGCPVLKNSIGFMECRVIEIHAPGNHKLFIGEIINSGYRGRAVPLSTLDYEGVYTGKV